MGVNGIYQCMLRHVGYHQIKKGTAIKHILKFKAADDSSVVNIAGIFCWIYPVSTDPPHTGRDAAESFSWHQTVFSIDISCFLLFWSH